MEDLPSFFGPVEALPWSGEHATFVEEQRAAALGSLFVDQLLTRCLGEQVFDLYPPRSPAAFRSLLRRVAEEAPTTWLRRCVELYLLLDYQDEARVHAFLQLSQLPDVPYARTIRGFHLLDQGRLAEAIAPLASAVDDLMPEDTRSVLIRLTADSHALIAFLRLAHPPVTDPDLLIECARACTREGSAAEAWKWVRKLPLDPALEPNRVDGIHVILSTAFGGGAEPAPVAAALQTLLSLPFEGPGEDEAVWNFCRSAGQLPAVSKELLVSWAVARLSAEGRHSEALALLKDPALAAAPGSNTAQRQLLRSGLESVLSPVLTSVDTLLRAPEAIAPPKAMEVDLAATPWAEAQPAARQAAPKSLIEAQSQQAARTKQPAAPSALPPSATPQRKTILPTSASPFRIQPSRSTPAPRKSLIFETKPAYSPAPSTVRDGFSPAPTSRAPSIAPLGPRRPAEPPMPPSARKPERSQPADPPARPAQPPPLPSQPSPEQSLSRSRSVQFPGAFDDAMEEDAPAEEPAPVAAKRKPKASRSKSSANLASTAEESEKPKARASRSKTMTGLSTLARDDDEEEAVPEPPTPRRSKRLSVQQHTGSPEVVRSAKTTAKKGKGKAKA